MNHRQRNAVSFRFSSALRERLRSNVELWTRQARLQQLKKGQVFMTVETRPGAKKHKSNSRPRIRSNRLIDGDMYRSTDVLAAPRQRETYTMQ